MMLGPTQAFNELVQDSSFIQTQPLSDSQPESSAYTQSSEHAASQPPKVSLRYDHFRNSTQDVLATIMTRAATMQNGRDTSPSRKRRRQEPSNLLNLSDSYVESSPLDDGPADQGPVIEEQPEQVEQSSSLTQPAANVIRYCDTFDMPTAVPPPSPPPSTTSYSNKLRVLARWPDRKWYPATVVGCLESEKVSPSPARRRTPARGSQPDEPLYSVKYDDGNTAEGLLATQLRLLDLRTGDKFIGRITSRVGKIVAAGVEITSSSSEDSMHNSQPDSLEAGTNLSHLPDAKGHTYFTFTAYNEKTKTRIEVADDCRYIRLADLCVTDRQVERQWTDRLWKGEYFGTARAETPPRSGQPSAAQEDWDGFGNSSLTSLATSPVQPHIRAFGTTPLNTPLISQSSALSFEQTAFVITGIKDEALKTALGKAISHRGGHVISSLQDALRVNADGVLVSDLRKPVIVVSDGFVRTATWMMALSLNLPIVSHRWVEDSAKRAGRQSVDWIPYALSTGHSDYLGGWSAPSPEMFLRASMPLSERLEQRHRTSTGLLQGQKCLLVMSTRSGLKDRDIFKCLLQTCGASYVETVTTEQQIRFAFGRPAVTAGSKSELAQSKRKRPRRSRQDSFENGRRARSLSEPGSTIEWDRVIVEDEKRLASVRNATETSSARSKRLKTKTWLFDCLIMGKVLPFV